MRRLFLMLASIVGLFGTSISEVEGSERRQEDTGAEYLIVSGGVSLKEWEWSKPQPHDAWWMNFVRAARIRIQEIRHTDPEAEITWMVYRGAYDRRSRQEGKALVPLIESVRDKYGVRLVYFSKTEEFVRYFNGGRPRERVKIVDLEYFGHSNKACWMFDYSNEIDGCSKVWFHETEIAALNRQALSVRAHVKSWGCYSGESMSGVWSRHFGVPMWGAVGKTQYRTEELPALAARFGRWRR
jgi:hypothetical protein